MSPEELVRAYFAAWNARDAAAVGALFAPGGTYQDPATGGPLAGAALERYAQGLFDAFPDLRLELIAQAPASSGELAAPWLLFGTHRGALGERAPTGRAVVLRGCDFIAARDGRLASVVGYFSLAELGAQLDGK